MIGVILRFLTDARLHPMHVAPTVKNCRLPDCGTCPYLTGGSHFTFSQGKYFLIKTIFPCNSQTLIYFLTYAGKNHDYVGQTSLTLRRRYIIHKQQIINPQYRQITLSDHIDTCARIKTPKFHTFPFYQSKCSFYLQQHLSKQCFFLFKSTKH